MNFDHRQHFLNQSAAFMFGLLCLTLLLAAWAGLSPLSEIHWSFRDFGIGIAGAGLMIACFSFVTSAWHQAEQLLGGALASCRWYDLIILAAIVGIVEELLFRGVLEPWVARIHPVVAFCSVNLLFGLLHAVSWTYALVATALGAFLSGLAHWPGEFNLLRPIIAHAVYDYIGFVWLAMHYRRTMGAAFRDSGSETD